MATVKRGGGAFALAMVAPIAMAEVTGAGASGFEVREKVHIAAVPDAVYAAVLTPKRWWDPKHTYSGDANRMTLEAKAGGCWCETLPGGGAVEHLSITYLAPPKAVRFRGALGPLQGMGVAGSMTITLTATDGGTDLALTYAVGGYAKDGFEDMSKGVDGVLAAQVARLKKAVETGSAT
jgi:uncharacterized protein YndB with AHSA1/START domain